MRRIYLYFLCLTVLAPGVALAAYTQDKPAEKAPVSSVAPATGFRAEFLEEIAYYEKRYTSLAETMPAEKYTWRPAEGVRSVGEVFTHIAGANYGVARALGTTPSAGLDFKSIMALSADKPKVIQALKDSSKRKMRTSHRKCSTTKPRCVAPSSSSPDTLANTSANRLPTRA